MKTDDLLPQAAQHIAYDPETGAFSWKSRPQNSRVRVGASAGTITAWGYLSIGFAKRHIRAHRLALYIATGRVPSKMVDHINGDRADNRLANLRECSPAENAHHSCLSRNNTSGYPGVTWHKARRKWRASIRVNYRSLHIGEFDNPEAAYAAYMAAKRQHHPFSPTGRSLPPVPEEMR